VPGWLPMPQREMGEVIARMGHDGRTMLSFLRVDTARIKGSLFTALVLSTVRYNA
jgi:hypothetical protein